MTAERASFVEDNIGLAHSCVRRYIGRGIEYDDLFQTACVGLIKAAENFDESRQLRFSTYAVPVILGELKQLFRLDGSVKVSRRVKELGMHAKRISDEFYAENGRAARISELAGLLGVSEQDAAQAMCAAQYPESIDDDKTGCVPAERFEEQTTERLALRQIIESLSPQDRAIITERYIKEQTQSRTALTLGMTQVQVSRRERRILEIIRNELKR